jgi:hypothetical protein
VMTMIVAVVVRLLSIVGDVSIILLSPPLSSHVLLPEKGGGLNSDSTRLREEDGPSHPLPPPFSSLPSPPLPLGH